MAKLTEILKNSGLDGRYTDIAVELLSESPEYGNIIPKNGFPSSWNNNGDSNVIAQYLKGGVV